MHMLPYSKYTHVCNPHPTPLPPCPFIPASRSFTTYTTTTSVIDAARRQILAHIRTYAHHAHTYSVRLQDLSCSCVTDVSSPRLSLPCFLPCFLLLSSTSPSQALLVVSARRSRVGSFLVSGGSFWFPVFFLLSLSASLCFTCNVDTLVTLVARAANVAGGRNGTGSTCALRTYVEDIR